MKNKIFSGMKLFASCILCCLFLSACGKSSNNHQLSTKNLVINGNMEEGEKTPYGWHTYNQVLNDITGWTTEESHSGKHSLKIENIGGTDAYWQGKPIIFREPANAFEASIWTKTKNMKNGKGKFTLSFDVFLKRDDGQQVKGKIFIDLPKTDHDWRQTKAEVLFTENIVKAIPYINLSDISVTYADDVSVKSAYIEPKNEDVLFDSNTSGTFTKIKSLKLVSDKGEGKIYEVKGPDGIMSADFIPIDPNKPYHLSGMFKSAGEGNSAMYLGYAPYTQDKKFITPQSENCVEKTETELAKPCSKEDTVICIKDGINWIAAGYMCVAFDVDNSGAFSDLPNFNLSQLGINRIQTYKKGWKIYLAQPCGVNYPADTKIREHKSGAGYNYMTSSDKIPSEWTVYGGINYGNSIYLEAKYVKIVILANYGQSQNTLMYFKNIKMRKSYASVKYIH